MAMDTGGTWSRGIGPGYAPDVVSSRAVSMGWIASLLVSLACASPPQEDSTALPDPVPPEPEIIEQPEPELAPVLAEDPHAAPPPSAATLPATPPAGSLTGIPSCDEYLALYRRCETHLKPRIMAGDRRSHDAEAARLQYFLGTPEAAALPQSCGSMLDALRVDCPERHRAPEPTP